MSNQIIKKIARDLSDIESLKIISITGGEPFLFFNEIVNVCKVFSSMGIKIEIVSNSAWAHTKNLALKRLSILKLNGLANYVTSVDSYHLEFITLDQVRNAINAALSLNINVVVKSLASNDFNPSERSLAELLEIPLGQEYLSYKIARPVISGRYSSQFESESGLPNKGNKFRGRCESVLNFPTISYDGSFYPCCGFGPKSYRKCGNILEKSLTELLSDMQNNLLFNLFSSIGPASVLNSLYKKGLFRENLKCSSTCDICNYIYSSPVIRKSVLLYLNGFLASAGKSLSRNLS
jgi:hypothetical protein